MSRERVFRHIATPALLVAVVVLCYWPALTATFIWDDDAHVTRNMALRSLDGLRWIWLRPGLVPAAEGYIPTQYYPLLHTSFWIQHRLWGLDPRGYHLTSVLLHAGVSLLAWALFRRLQVPGALLGAAIFAVHPVHVESVAWITEQKNLLSACFYLTAALAYLRFSPPEGPPTSGKRRDYALALLLFLGAMLSKTVVCTLPAAMLLLLWWKRGRIDRRDVTALAPMAVIAAALSLVGVVIHHQPGNFPAEALSKQTLVEKCLVAGRALCFYAASLAWPSRQSFVYPAWSLDSRAVAQYLFPLAAVCAVVGAWLARRRIGTGPLVALLFFAGTLFPALGFVDFYRFSFVADHYQYLASLGPIALAAAAAATLTARWDRRIAVSAAVAVLAIFGALTFRRGHVFRNNETLWQDTLAKNPECWMCLNNLGADRLAQNRLDEARTLFERALQVRADHWNARVNLGLVLQRQGHIEQAIEQFDAAAKDRRHRSAHFRIGQLRAEQGRFAEAIDRYRQALEADPERAEILNALGTAQVNDGRADEAVASYRRALAADPELTDARYNLALLLMQRGLVKEAREHFTRARTRAAAAGSQDLVRAIDERLGALGVDAGGSAR